MVHVYRPLIDLSSSVGLARQDVTAEHFSPLLLFLTRNRATEKRDDFLFRPERGRLELYDPARHGVWEIATGEDGRLLVAQVEGGLETDAEAEGEAFAAEAHPRDYLAKHLVQHGRNR